jgi:hypothetical protein
MLYLQLIIRNTHEFYDASSDMILFLQFYSRTLFLQKIKIKNWTFLIEFSRRILDVYTLIANQSDYLKCSFLKWREKLECFQDS